MQHLTEEHLVAHYFGDADARSDTREHLAQCAQCAQQFDTLRRVLELVKESPVPERGEDYGTQVWNRLRWKLGSDRRRRGWTTFLAAAAMFAVAFFAGMLWRGNNHTEDIVAVQTATATATTATQPAIQPESTDRLVLVVVGDHLDASERVLLEVANADPNRTFLVGSERTSDLVSANRIYRQTAAQRGDDRVATLLADLEPILIELSNAGDKLEGEKLAELQKRIEAKGLLFKVRVMGAQAAEQLRPIKPADTL